MLRLSYLRSGRINLFLAQDYVRDVSEGERQEEEEEEEGGEREIIDGNSRCYNCCSGNVAELFPEPNLRSVHPQTRLKAFLL